MSRASVSRWRRTGQNACTWGTGVRETIDLGVAIPDVGDEAARRQAAGARRRDAVGRPVHGHVGHDPQALVHLPAVAEEGELAGRDDRRQDVHLLVHLRPHVHAAPLVSHCFYCGHDEIKGG
jgi:hypothetical protein